MRIFLTKLGSQFDVMTELRFRGELEILQGKIDFSSIQCYENFVEKLLTYINQYIEVYKGSIDRNTYIIFYKILFSIIQNTLPLNLYNSLFQALLQISLYSNEIPLEFRDFIFPINQNNNILRPLIVRAFIDSGFEAIGEECFDQAICNLLTMFQNSSSQEKITMIEVIMGAGMVERLNAGYRPFFENVYQFIIESAFNSEVEQIILQRAFICVLSVCPNIQTECDFVTQLIQQYEQIGEDNDMKVEYLQKMVLVFPFLDTNSVMQSIELIINHCNTFPTGEVPNLSQSFIQIRTPFIAPNVIDLLLSLIVLHEDENSIIMNCIAAQLLSTQISDEEGNQLAKDIASMFSARLSEETCGGLLFAEALYFLLPHLGQIKMEQWCYDILPKLELCIQMRVENEKHLTDKWILNALRKFFNCYGFEPGYLIRFIECIINNTHFRSGWELHKLLRCFCTRLEMKGEMEESLELWSILTRVLEESRPYQIGCAVVGSMSYLDASSGEMNAILPIAISYAEEASNNDDTRSFVVAANFICDCFIQSNPNSKLEILEIIAPIIVILIKIANTTEEFEGRKMALLLTNEIQKEMGKHLSEIPEIIWDILNEDESEIENDGIREEKEIRRMGIVRSWIKLLNNDILIEFLRRKMEMVMESESQKAFYKYCKLVTFAVRDIFEEEYYNPNDKMNIISIAEELITEASQSEIRSFDVSSLFDLEKCAKAVGKIYTEFVSNGEDNIVEPLLLEVRGLR